MKMKKYVSIILKLAFLTFTACLLLSLNKFQTPPIEKVIDFCPISGGMSGAEIGIVKDNEIRFYFNQILSDYSITRWQEAHRLHFTLPPDCKDVIEKVFGRQGFGLIIDDRIIFYELLDSDTYAGLYYGWKESTNGTFFLPPNCQGVITLFNKIGVIVDNVIKFYWFDTDQNIWVVMPQIEYTLPPDCTDVFGYSDNVLGIVTGSNLKFYYNWRDNDWAEQIDWEFNLPDDYQCCFTTYFDWFCVSTRDKIKFYESAKSWAEITEIEFYK